jgi:hypothetical protein
LLRRFPVAPPRVGPVVRDRADEAGAAPSIRRRSRSTPGGAGPDRPAGPARLTADEVSRLRSGTGSLIDRTAHLFAGADDPVVRRSMAPAPGGGRMFHPTTGDQSPLLPGSPAQPPDDPGVFGDLLPAVVPGDVLSDPWAEQPRHTESSGAVLDRLVDAVVERIEERVVDELERRGRNDWRVI